LEPKQALQPSPSAGKVLQGEKSKGKCRKKHPLKGQPSQIDLQISSLTVMQNRKRHEKNIKEPGTQ
jgi:hypothetical protein